MFLSKVSSMLGGKSFQGNVFHGFKAQPQIFRAPSFSAPKFPSPFHRTTQARFLSIHEYQSQSLMKDYNISVPQGGVASTPEEAFNVAVSLNTQDLVIKAQVLAGGRGLGHFDNGFKGGVHKCSSPLEVRDLAAKMLGHKLFTKQTGPEGKPVNKVLIAKRHYVRRESYFAILLDRTFGGPVMIGSKEGGVDIEKVAEENPSAIVKIGVDLDQGPTEEQAGTLAAAMGFAGVQKQAAQLQIRNLFKLFKERDCTMVEVNPFVETNEGTVMCMDAKLNFDDNAEFRQKEIFALEDSSQKDAREVAAKKADLNYIALDGQIGCLVNGAGLAMATMDIIKLNGAEPANFLDVGGGATKEQIISAIRIISNDPHVKVILINIFGGIMRCDIIALGLIAAASELSLKVPLVVRLQGTNVQEAKKLIANSGLRIMTADDLDDAAQKAVNAYKILSLAEKSGLDVKFELPL